MRLHGPDEPVYTIGVAARLLGVNPQTLRQIEREGLLEPARTEANTRLYSQNDLLLLQRICFLVREEGVNLAGVKMILQIESKHGNTTIRYREVTERVSRGAKPDEGKGNS
ncbi:MAG: MerR family transcriptional regulator [Firmicutes bacterium]|nr:MerR family transcriptional regulator [Bacillota bacterium]MDD4793288.1 MerR family transcriptional regulator [Bacillota bacterium]